MTRRDMVMVAAALLAFAVLDWVKLPAWVDGRLARVWWEPRTVAEKRLRDLLAEALPRTLGGKTGGRQTMEEAA